MVFPYGPARMVMSPQRLMALKRYRMRFPWAIPHPIVAKMGIDIIPM